MKEIAQECVEGYLYVAAPLSLLLFRRPPSRGGYWVPLSGKVEQKDASFLSALRREMVEETGFHPPGPVIALDWDVPFDGSDGKRWRLHAYGIELPARWIPRLSDEHEESEWVSFREASRRLHYEDNRQAVLRLQERLAISFPDETD